MKTHVVFLALFSLLSTRQPQPVEPALTTEALSADRLSIYRDFLTNSPDAGSDIATLNVALVTDAFLHKSYVDPDRSCLGTAHIFELSTPQLHKLPADAFPADHIHLVDLSAPPPPPPAANKALALFHHQPAAVPPPHRPDNFLTLSEIVFDASHTHAAFRYTFTSGPGSARGATAIYELDHDTWKASKATCSQWAR